MIVEGKATVYVNGVAIGKAIERSLILLNPDEDTCCQTKTESENGCSEVKALDITDELREERDLHMKFVITLDGAIREIERLRNTLAFERRDRELSSSSPREGGIPVGRV